MALRKRHLPLLFVPVYSVRMIIMIFASCLIYCCFNKNVFIVELIIWPNTQIHCQPYELLLKSPLFTSIQSFLLACLPPS